MQNRQNKHSIEGMSESTSSTASAPPSLPALPNDILGYMSTFLDNQTLRNFSFTIKHNNTKANEILLRRALALFNEYVRNDFSFISGEEAIEALNKIIQYGDHWLNEKPKDTLKRSYYFLHLIYDVMHYFTTTTKLTNNKLVFAEIRSKTYKAVMSSFGGTMFPVFNRSPINGNDILSLDNILNAYLENQDSNKFADELKKVIRRIEDMVEEYLKQNNNPRDGQIICDKILMASRLVSKRIDAELQNTKSVKPL